AGTKDCLLLRIAVSAGFAGDLAGISNRPTMDATMPPCGSGEIFVCFRMVGLLINAYLTVLCFIGTACATGHVIDIPIIIRSLADSLGRVDYEELPLPIHPSMLAILDAGVTTDDPARLVDVYQLNWWAGTDEPDEDDVLHMFNVVKCLEFHQQQLTPGTSPPEPSAPAPVRTPVPANLCP